MAKSGKKADILTHRFEPTEMGRAGKVLYYAFCSVLLLSMSTLLIMLLCGSRFADTLSALGLYHQEQGVFAGCEGRNDKNSRYCIQPVRKSDKTWREIEEGMAFSFFD